MVAGRPIKDSTEKRLMRRPVLLFAIFAVLAACLGVFISLRGRSIQAGPGPSTTSQNARRFTSQSDCQTTLTASPPAGIRAVVIGHQEALEPSAIRCP